MFGRVEHFDEILTSAELARAKRLLHCFAVPTGQWEGDRHAVVSVRDPTLGLLLDPTGTAPLLPASGYDLDLAGHVVGAVFLASELNASAELVQPFRLWLSAVDADAFMQVSYPDNSIDVTSPASFVVVKPPAVGHAEVSAFPPVARALASMIVQARSGSGVASQILQSLGPFIESHAYILNRTILTNLTPLGTAFEVLFALQGVQDKKRRLQESVETLTKSVLLAEYVRDFYEARSGVVHGAVNPDPLVPNKHMTHLRFAQRLFWFCLRSKLTHEFDTPWQEHNSPDVTFTAFMPTQDQERERLEWSLEPNVQRLKKLSGLSADRVSKHPTRHEEFLRLLRGLHANPLDRTGPPNICRAALLNVLKILQSSLLHTAQNESDQHLAINMRHLANMIRQLGEKSNLEGHEIKQAAVNLSTDDAPGAYVPLIAGESLVGLCFGNELVGGLGDLLLAHSGWGWPRTGP
jgi:hypothetical protein